MCQTHDLLRAFTHTIGLRPNPNQRNTETKPLTMTTFPSLVGFGPAQPSSLPRRGLTKTIRFGYTPRPPSSLVNGARPHFEAVFHLSWFFGRWKYFPFRIGSLFFFGVDLRPALQSHITNSNPSPAPTSDPIFKPNPSITPCPVPAPRLEGQLSRSLSPQVARLACERSHADGGHGDPCNDDSFFRVLRHLQRRVES